MKKFKKLLKQKWFWYLVILPVTLTLAFYYTLWKGFNYLEQRDINIYMAGYEKGNFEGLNDGYNAAYDEFYDKLSPNKQVSQLFKKYFPKQEEARIMRAISLAESHGKQTAVNTKNRNGSIDFGFFQINTIHKKKGETVAQFNQRMCDLEANFKEARRILDTQGLTAWSTYTNKKYLTYLN